MMEVIRNTYNLKPRHYGCVATIGNFDGVHRGHQTIIARLKVVAKTLCLPTTVISFEPLPREFFSPSQPPPRLSRFREKVLLLQQQGVDRFFCLRFEPALAELCPEDFIKDVIVDKLGVRYLVVGDDFRFGRERSGDFNTLQQAGARYGFEVVATKTVLGRSARISSTRVRQALASGDMVLATALLGRPYTMTGRVSHGDKRGRKMGYPTANIHIHRRETPVSGIFVVRVYGLSDKAIEGVASVGVRPTFSDDDIAILEVHLFDFERTIYGRYVAVEFLHKIRDERKFGSVEALIAAMQDDANQARTWFASTK